jgi:hypothetical protein
VTKKQIKAISKPKLTVLIVVIVGLTVEITRKNNIGAIDAMNLGILLPIAHKKVHLATVNITSLKRDSHNKRKRINLLKIKVHNRATINRNLKKFVMNVESKVGIQKDRTVHRLLGKGKQNNDMFKYVVLIYN